MTRVRQSVNHPTVHALRPDPPAGSGRYSLCGHRPQQPGAWVETDDPPTCFTCRRLLIQIEEGER